MRNIWSNYKGGIILLMLLLVVFATRTAFSWVDDIRKDANEARKALKQAEETIQEREQAYRDSLYHVRALLLKALTESDIRLDELNNTANEATETYLDDVSVIDGYTTLDERIDALTRAIVRQDSSWDRYTSRDDARRPR